MTSETSNVIFHVKSNYKFYEVRCFSFEESSEILKTYFQTLRTLKKKISYREVLTDWFFHEIEAENLDNINFEF